MTPERRNTIAFLKNLFREYYQKHEVEIPRDFTYREFAIQPWESESYVRHLSFRTYSEIKFFLGSKGPRHFYYSSARYDLPGMENMDEKNWRSSDLVFDIDVDHVDECIDKVKSITNIFGEKISIIEDECFRVATIHVVNLVSVLVDELGIEESRIRIEFSGNRGFHVTVYLDDMNEYALLDSSTRRELVNYIKAVNLLDETLNPSLSIKLRKKSHLVEEAPLSLDIAGLRGRLAHVVNNIMKYYNDLFQIDKNEDIEIALREIAKRYLSIPIDEQVTIDTKRLIRAPFSLHGKTGLLVKPVKLDSLPYFKLDVDLSPFKDLDSLKVFIIANENIHVKLFGEEIKLSPREILKTPPYLGIYLLCKGLAVLPQDMD